MRNLLIISLFVTACYGCRKASVLDAYPDSRSLTLSSLEDVERLLANSYLYDWESNLFSVVADDYTISTNLFNRLNLRDQSMYQWNDDYLNSIDKLEDWDNYYSKIYVANVVIEYLDRILKSFVPQQISRLFYLEGSALFIRAMANFQLNILFADVYSPNTSSLGTPLKLTTSLDEPIERKPLPEVFEQIEKDILAAIQFFEESDYRNPNTNPLSTAAAYAFAARLYLYMGRYELSLRYSQLALGNKPDALLDFNNFQSGSVNSFLQPDILYPTSYLSHNSLLLIFLIQNEAPLSPELAATLHSEDQRLRLFYRKANNNYYYNNPYNNSPFVGFAGITLSEMFLNQMESEARLYRTDSAKAHLKEWVRCRYAPAYTPDIDQLSYPELLSTILLERRKEFVFRNIRLSDVKRLNRDYENITLKRALNNTTITLAPNDPRLVLLIPRFVIQTSLLEQNKR